MLAKTTICAAVTTMIAALAAPVEAQEAPAERLATSTAEAHALRSTLTAYGRTVAVQNAAFRRLPIAVSFFRVPSIADEPLNWPELPDLQRDLSFDRLPLSQQKNEFPRLPPAPRIERVPPLEDEPGETSESQSNDPEARQSATDDPRDLWTRQNVGAIVISAGLAAFFGGAFADTPTGRGLVVGGTALSLSGLGLLISSGEDESRSSPPRSPFLSR